VSLEDGVDAGAAGAATALCGTHQVGHLVGKIVQQALAAASREKRRRKE
jgi:hypothetical protein